MSSGYLLGLLEFFGYIMLHEINQFNITATHTNCYVKYLVVLNAILISNLYFFVQQMRLFAKHRVKHLVTQTSDLMNSFKF